MTGALANIPFPFGIDATTGEYGYIKAGADSVTPFKSGLPDIIQKQFGAVCGPSTNQMPYAETVPCSGYTTAVLYNTMFSANMYYIYYFENAESVAITGQVSTGTGASTQTTISIPADAFYLRFYIIRSAGITSTCAIISLLTS